MLHWRRNVACFGISISVVSSPRPKVNQYNNVHHKGADMQYKEIAQIILAGVVVPVAVQVLNQLAQIYVDEATKKSKFTIRIG